MAFRKSLGVGMKSSTSTKAESARPNFRTHDIVVDEAQVRAHILSKQNSTTAPALSPAKKTVEDHNDPELLDGYWRLIQRKLSEKQSTGDNIVVVTRTRPFNDREIEANTTKCVRVLEEDASGQQQVWIVNPMAPEAGPVKFSFDYCFDSFDPNEDNFVDQKTVFDRIGLDLLAKTWGGYNSSLFAYGQTGSGKTYSIMGYDQAKGLIPRICGLLFYMIATHGKSRGLQVDATYLEIYQERIIDLLNASAQTGPIKPKDRLKLEAKRKKLMSDKSNEANMLEAREILKQLSPNYQGAAQPKVREDPSRGVVVDNLRRFAVSSYQDCADLLEEGLTNRTTAATAMNSTSSRSHAVFTLEITEKEESVNATEQALLGKSGKKKAQTTKITLIDLAGSERAKSADTKGDRLKEGGAINKSLSVLGHVISLLAKASNDQVAEEERQMAAAEGSPGKRRTLKKEPAERHIPFRDSVLTWILRDSLVGNSKTVMLAALSPAAVNFQETLSTLRFANQAKLIKTKAVRNEDPTERLIRELQEEIFMLKERIAYLEGEGAGQAVGTGGDGVNGAFNSGRPQQPQQYSDYLASMGVFEPENDYDVTTNFEQNFVGDGYETAAGQLPMMPMGDGTQYGGEGEIRTVSGSSVVEEQAIHRAHQAERIAAMAADSERRAVAALLLAEERRQKAERNMAELRARLQHRRKVVRLHRLSRNATDEGREEGESVEEEQNRLVADGGPYLTFLSEDPSMSSQLKIYVAGGQRLRVGTSSAKIEQDVKVAGLGITPETAVFTMKSKKDGLTLCVSPASMNAQVRVNGKLLSYRSTNSSGKKSKEECYLKVGDRVVLGTCAHVMLVCESESARLSRQSLPDTPHKLSNYEQAIREVVLQRTESQEEYGRRLAAMVMNKLRGPRSRAVFAATMVRALRGVFEANEVAVSMGTNKRFKVHVGGLVDNDNLFSLRLDEVLPHQRAHVTVHVLLHSHEYRVIMGEAVSQPSVSEPWCICELDEFLDLVEDLKTTLQSCRAVAESVVTPVGGETYGPDVGGDGVSAAFKTGRGAGAITRAFFMAADEDGDGVISRDELVDAASALGLTPSEAEMDTLFRQYDVESNNELSLGEFDQFVRDQLCAKFDECLMKVKSRRKQQEGRAKAEIAAHLQQHLQALQTQLQLAVRMKEYDIAVELEENVQHVQDELAIFKKQQMEESGMDEADTHAELLRMKEEALQYSADLRRALMDLADSHAALLMALEPLLDAGKGADVEELEGVAAAGFTAARVGEAASQVAHDLQVLVQGNAAEDAANDELAEMAAAQLIAGRKVSSNAMKALEDRVTRNSNGNITSPEGNSRRMVTPDDEVLLKNVSHTRDIVNRLVGTSGTMSRVEEESDEEGTHNPLVREEKDKDKKKKKKKKSSKKDRDRDEEEER